MTRKNISDAVGGIGSRHIEETASYQAKKQKSIWLKFGAIAAWWECLVWDYSAKVQKQLH